MLRTLRDAFIALIVERSVNWLAPAALPYAWTGILVWLTWDILRWAGVRDRLTRAYSGWNQKKIVGVYVVAFILGGSLFCIYLYGCKRIFAFAVAHKAIKVEEKTSELATSAVTPSPPSRPKIEEQVAKISQGLSDLRNDLIKSNSVDDEARLALLRRQAQEVSKEQELLSTQQKEALQRDTLSIESLEKARQQNLQKKEAERQQAELAKQEEEINIRKQRRLAEQQIDEREKQFAKYFVDSTDYAIGTLYKMLQSVSGGKAIVTNFPGNRPTLYNSELFKDGRFRNGQHFMRLNSHKEWEFEIITSGNPGDPRKPVDPGNLLPSAPHKYFGFQIRTPTASMSIGNQYFQMGTWQLEQGDLSISCRANDNSELYSQRCSYAEYQKPVHEALRALIQTCWDALPLTTITQPSPTPDTEASQR